MVLVKINDHARSNLQGFDTTLFAEVDKGDPRRFGGSHLLAQRGNPLKTEKGASPSALREGTPFLWKG
ncbi:hypothetical protein HKBW3S47_01586 [Candidatus Hakubella thermalkaliphila]|uniref:Uncharacterized protein n=1 Tax=Candidatus Hakubella thermalkaliphila TaxID=2754717 RepID=A0A6V8Q542_9ACTN|nr:hypothetical protein [Candidatus Hakubella thermalkaliphila]GFP39889.1 hypothetical protein HKBW3S47_01586 [Candidatus Hakubella thermalkaliphila]